MKVLSLINYQMFFKNKRTDSERFEGGRLTLSAGYRNDVCFSSQRLA